MSSVLKVVRPFVLILGLPSGSAFAEVALAPNKPAPAVSTVEAARREIVEQVVVTGSLVPRDEILVTPEIEGYRVTEVLVEEGMRVERGQILARLSRDLIDQQIAQQDALVSKASATVPQAQSNIEQAEAAEMEARLAFERAKQLMSSGNGTAAIMEGRTASLRQTEGQARLRAQWSCHRKGGTRSGAGSARRTLIAPRPHRDPRAGSRYRKPPYGPRRYGSLLLF